MTVTTIATRCKDHLRLPALDPSVRIFCSAIKIAAESMNTETAQTSIEDVEQRFLSALSLEILVASIPATPLWGWTRDLIIRMFPDRILVEDGTGNVSLRVGTALARRLEETNLTEVPDAGNEFVAMHAATVQAASERRASFVQQPSGADATMPPPRSNASADGGTGDNGRSGDINRARRTVQAHFMDKGGERAKFTGDLSKAPSFHLWEQRLRSLLKSMQLSEPEKVTMLSEALADPALTFYYNSICPDDSRAGNSIREAAELPDNVAANVPTLSGALAAIRKHFCTDAARNVLKQELDQLRLSHIERDEQVTKPVALGLLKDRIVRLSSNGPPEFRSETCMISALRKCLLGEEWAVSPMINASDRAASDPTSKTLEHFVQTLISYLRETETLTGSVSGSQRSSPAVPMSHGLAHAYFGDSRASPRRTRVTYQNSVKPKVRFEANRPTGLPNGMELRKMLTRSPQIPSAPTQGQSPAARRQPRVCWNCDQPGHLFRDCPKPKRSRVEIARAMVVEDIPALEIAIFMAQEVDSLSLAHEGAGIEGADPNEEEDEMDEDEDPAQVFDTLLATMSRDSHPRQDFC